MSKTNTTLGHYLDHRSSSGSRGGCADHCCNKFNCETLTCIDIVGTKFILRDHAAMHSEKETKALNERLDEIDSIQGDLDSSERQTSAIREKLRQAHLELRRIVNGGQREAREG